MTAGWLTTPTTQGASVTPLDDNLVHSPYDEDCVCGPTYERFPSGGLLVIHHSPDGREQTERQT